MFKLYRSTLHPKRWVVYAVGTGWLVFPDSENGWEARQPARGLDPVYLREVSIEKGYAAGLPKPEFSVVA